MCSASKNIGKHNSYAMKIEVAMEILMQIYINIKCFHYGIQQVTLKILKDLVI